MNLSQYPKKGNYLPITGYEKEIINECEEKIGHPDSFYRFDDPRPSKWAANSDLWVHGYWCWDWANSYEHVTELDPDAMTVSLKEVPENRIRGYKPGQRFCFLNILEEVNTPGDYYVDREKGLLYFYPPSQMDENTELLFSVLETPFFDLQDAQGVTIAGVTMECIRGIALAANGVSDLTIDGCHFRNIGNHAIDCKGGLRNRILNCTIHDCGDGGIEITGGDRMTLEPSGSEIINNHIYHIASWSRCYRPAILPKGVGITIAHNLIHDLPHIAILYSGNDMQIEYNEIYSVCMETGDAGAIYSGRDVTFRGNHISHNYIHHLGGVGLGTMGIYNDDVLSGTIMEHNYFYEVGRAVMLGGGVDYVVKNNVFVKCYPAVHMDCRAAHTEFFWTACYEEQRRKLYNGVQSFLHPNDPSVTLDCTKSPYIDRYPELAYLVQLYDDGRQLAATADIVQNVFCSKPLFRYYWDRRDANAEKFYDCGELVSLSEEELSCIFDTRHDVKSNWSPGKGDWRFARNYTAAPKDFEDAEWGLIGLRPECRAMEYGFEWDPEEFDSIGLLPQERTDNPPRILTCLTYPYKGESQPLTLGIRNMEDAPVSGDIQLYSGNPQIQLTQRTVSFQLAPHEEIHITVGDIHGAERFTVEARGVQAGIRPARAENYLGNWNRF